MRVNLKVFDSQLVKKTGYPLGVVEELRQAVLAELGEMAEQLSGAECVLKITREAYMNSFSRGSPEREARRSLLTNLKREAVPRLP